MFPNTVYHRLGRILFYSLEFRHCLGPCIVWLFFSAGRDNVELYSMWSQFTVYCKIMCELNADCHNISKFLNDCKNTSKFNKECKNKSKLMNNRKICAYSKNLFFLRFTFHPQTAHTLLHIYVSVYCTVCTVHCTMYMVQFTQV